MKKYTAIAFAAALSLFAIASPAEAQDLDDGTCAEADDRPPECENPGIIDGGDGNDVYPIENPEEGEGEIEFEVLGPVCVGDFPYIQYRITGEGLAPGATATITLSNSSGVVDQLSNQPLEGQIIWPGASVNPPDWPGWVLINGTWFEDSSDQVLREGLTVRAEINPETEGFVSYPPATAECASPENPPPPTVPPQGLPATGSSAANGILQVGGLLALTGLVVFLAARRRRPAPTV